MTSGLSNPHDALVRKLLSDPVDAASEIRFVTPKTIVGLLDWGEFELVDGSLVSAELQARYTDLLFRIERSRRTLRELASYAPASSNLSPADSAP